MQDPTLNVNPDAPKQRAPTRYTDIGNGKKRKLRTNGKISKWGPVPKRRRWGSKNQKKISEEMAEVLNSNLSATGTELSLLKIKLTECMTRLSNPTAYLMSIPENERSPSPQPIYDQKGIRLNTRELRVRNKLVKERDEILGRIMELNPNFKPPADWRKPKKEQKIYIPVDEYPDYNFFGLIIGPRGTTQKRLQKETNTKIAIRGKGSFVDGKANRIPQPDDNEPMHVLVTGPDEDSVNKAVKMIKDLLIPITTSENEHKAKQLRELALLSGTMISATRCRICGGAGHPVWKCPDRSGDRWTPANVQCAICGELSHVTADCKLARGWSAQKMARHAANGGVQSLEAEYDNFMKELTSGNGDGMGPKAPVAAIGNVGGYAPPPQQFAPQQQYYGSYQQYAPNYGAPHNGYSQY